MDSMAIMAEKDNANQACFGALSGKTTLANEGMSNLQGDPAVAERINALMEGDPSVATSKHALRNGMSDTTGLPCPPDCVAAPGSEHIYHVHLSQSQIHNASNSHTGDMQVIAAVPVYVYLDDTANKVQKRSRKEAKGQSLPSRRRVSKLPRKGRQNGSEDLSTEVVKTLSEWTGQAMAEGGEDLSKQVSIKFEWKNRDVGLNQVTFDEATMPAPVCSCTRTPQRCYKWGNGGWQSACCTPSISMYPLPFLPIKRHGRVNGRKMSGSAFTKLLSRMAAEGHDLSTPLDLKDHWAKHGTNGWITIK